MKKFYTTLVLAAAVAFSASAADLQSKQLRYQESMVGNTIAVENSSKAMKAPVAKAKPQKVEDIYGYYPMVYASIYGSSDGFAKGEGSLAITKGEKANSVEIVGFGGSLPVIGTFDSAKGTLTIPNHQIVAPSVSGVPGYSGPAYFDHMVATDNGDGTVSLGYSDADIVATFDEEGNLVFDTYDGFNTRAGTTSYGLKGGISIVTTRMKAPSNDGWADAGKATLTDGWYSPGIRYMCFTEPLSGDIPPFEVSLQRSTTNPNLFRLWNPWGNYNELLNSLITMENGQQFEPNTSVLAGVVEFDITDPTCVLVRPDVFSGLFDYAMGLDMFYPTNAAGDYVLTDNEYNEGISIEERIEIWKEVLTESGEQNTLSVYDPSAAVVIINDAQFKGSGDTYTTWSQLAQDLKEYDPNTFAKLPSNIDMTSVIMLPDFSGINNVIMDNTNSTLEYYNLQGVRVENPSNGIFIRRQGNDVQKVFVR